MNAFGSSKDSTPLGGSTPWRWLASSAVCKADAVRLACVLEATAPKVGNVHPAARYDNLCFSDFVTAADRTADAFSEIEQARQLGRIGDAIFAAVTASVSATKTNVNLGIVLLLGPLLATEPEGLPTMDCVATRLATWNLRIAEMLANLDGEQGASIAAAIACAGAGGMRVESLGDDHSLDVTVPRTGEYEIIEAMRVAAPRDRIAKQYAGDFCDLFTVVVPTLVEHVARCGDLLKGIVHAHIALIAKDGDSLIARKCGQAQSERIATLARQCLDELTAVDTRGNAGAGAESDCIGRLDAVLRSDSNRLNPGTTADLIAAAIYVLLRVHRKG